MLLLVHNIIYIWNCYWRFMTSSNHKMSALLQNCLCWIFYVSVLSCVCYVFVRVCLYVLCGHLLGKSWPLGPRLWCLLWVCHFPIGILGQVWYLIVSIPDLCTLTYFVKILYKMHSSYCLIINHYYFAISASTMKSICVIINMIVETVLCITQIWS